MTTTCSRSASWLRCVVALAGVAALVACDPTITPRRVGPVYSPAWETSATFAAILQGNSTGGTLVIGYNDFGAASIHGWAWSADYGATWTTCNAVTPGCGGPGAVVPLATGLLGQHNQVSWRGDPAVAAPPSGGIVVAANLANSTLRPTGLPDSIVASVSLDGGRTFTGSQFVNDTNCIGAWEDQEAITFDPESNARLWVAWRHRGTEIGVFGGCIRAGDVNPSTGRIEWINDPAPFPTSPEFGWGIGGLLVRAAGDVVSVVYAHTDQLGATAPCGTSVNVVWKSVTSLDGGSTWPIAATIHTSAAQTACIPAGINTVRTGIRNFGFARALNGGMWVAVPSDGANSILVFSSVDDGATWVQSNIVQVPNSLHFFPTMAVDEFGRAALSFQTVDTTGAVANTWFTRGGTPILLSGPYSPAGTAPPRAFGDYADMAVIPAAGVASRGETFMPVWSETAAGVSVINAAMIRIDSP